MLQPSASFVRGGGDIPWGRHGKARGNRSRICLRGSALNASQPITSASKLASTHARHQVSGSETSSLDTVLHLTRYEWVAANVLTSHGEDRLVDLGCGTGLGIDVLADRCAEVVGVDIDPNILHLASSQKSHVSFQVADVTEARLLSRLRARHATLVTCMETIEHVEDFPQLVRNAADLLADEGTLVVGTPNRVMTYNRYPGRRHMDSSHVQEFTPFSLRFVL